MKATELEGPARNTRLADALKCGLVVAALVLVSMGVLGMFEPWTVVGAAVLSVGTVLLFPPFALSSVGKRGWSWVVVYWTVMQLILSGQFVAFHTGRLSFLENDSLLVVWSVLSLPFGPLCFLIAISGEYGDNPFFGVPSVQAALLALVIGTIRGRTTRS